MSSKLGSWFTKWRSTILLAIVAGALLMWTIIIGTREPPNKLAQALLQSATLLFGVWTSYHFGKISASDAAKAANRLHARPAFRRMVNLYRALGRQRTAIETALNILDANSATIKRNGEETPVVEMSHVRVALQGLYNIVIEQIYTAEDAKEDWRDIVPDQVTQIEKHQILEGGNDAHSI